MIEEEQVTSFGRQDLLAVNDGTSGLSLTASSNTGGTVVEGEAGKYPVELDGLEGTRVVVSSTTDGGEVFAVHEEIGGTTVTTFGGNRKY